MVRVLRRLEVDVEDVLLVRAARLLVDGALVQARVLRARRVDGRHVDDGQLAVEHLGRGLDKLRRPAVPPGALEEEAVDVHALLRRRRDILLHLPQHLRVHLHAVERPALVRARNLLAHRREEALGVEEPGHPEHVGAAVKEPAVELRVALNEVAEPKAERRRPPRHALPRGGHTRVVHRVEGVAQLVAHDDRARDGKLEVLEHTAHHRNDALDAVNLLSEEDIHGRLAALLVERRLHLVAHVVSRKLLEHVIRKALDGRLARLAAAAAALLRLDVDDRAEHRVGHVRLVRNVRVRVEAEHLGRVDEREFLDELAVLVDRLLDGDDVALVEAEVVREHVVAEPRLRIRVEQALVKVVRDAAAVLDLADHVAHRVPRDALARVDLVEVVLHKLHAREEVRLVELVGDVPAERAELAALLHRRVEERDRVEHRLPERQVVHVEHVLRDPVVRALEARLDALRRLVRELDARLQQADRELRVLLRRDPKAEVLVDLLRHRQRVEQLVHKVEAEVAVLQQHPAARLHELLHQAPRVHLLALAHRNGARLRLLLLRQRLDCRRRVAAHRQQADHRRARVRLLPHLLEVEDDALREPLAERVANVLARLVHGAVGAPRADEERAAERVERVLVAVGQLRLLRGVLVVPVLPALLVARHLVEDLAELRQLTELDNVEPRHVRDPPARLLLHRVHVERSASLDEDLELLQRHAAALDVRLEREEQREEELVDLVQPAARVLEHAEREVVDDVLDALVRDRRRLRARHRLVKQPEELLQRRLVHHVDHAHLDDEEVEDAAARRDRAVLLARRVDLHLRLRGDHELVVDLLRGALRHREHVDERLVVDERSLGAREAQQQVVLELLHLLLVRRDVLEQLRALRLELVLLLQDHAAEQLVLETLDRHRKVDDGRLRADLGRVARVAELGRDVEHKAVHHVDLLVADLHLDRAPALDEVALEHVVEDGVELLVNVLEEQRATAAEAVLEVVAEVLVVQRADLKLVRRLAVHDPLLALALGVDQQREARRLRHDDAVLDRKLVVREALQRPLADRRVVDQHADDVEVVRERHAAALQFALPLVEERRAEVLVEGPAVRQERRREHDVADEAPDLVRKRLALQRPALLLAAEAIDERRRRLHLAAACVGVVLQVLLLLDGRVVLGLHNVELALLLVELRLGRREVRHGKLELVLLNRQVRLERQHFLVDRVERDHRARPRAETGDVAAHLLRRLEVEVLGLHVRLEQLDRLLVDRVLREVLQRRQEVALAHDLEGLSPRGLERRAVGVGRHGVETQRPQQQHAVHPC
eukprot:Opistho-1_new@25059